MARIPKKKTQVLLPLSASAKEMYEAVVGAPAVKTWWPNKIPDEVWELVQHGLGVARYEDSGGDQYAWRFVPKGGA